MKENTLRDKIISFILWILLWWIIVYSYWTYTWRWSVMFPKQWGLIWTTTWWGNFDAGAMSDEQLERMATRAWITSDELKKRLASWETLRDIMPARTWSWTRSGWNFQWRWTTGTWSN